MSRTALKYGLIAILLGLLLWLYLSGDNRIKRMEAINQALAEKRFPELTAKEKENFDSILYSAIKVKGIKDTSYINQPYTDKKNLTGELHVFVVSPALEELTRCGKGNAVYDSRLNSIFVDISLLRPTDWMIYDPATGLTLLENDLPFLKVYLSFVILHELGHHALHHGTAGHFDLTSTGDKTSRRKEEEADKYAYTGFTAFLGDNPLVQKQVEEIADIDGEGFSPFERSSAGLLVMGQNMLLSMQYGLSPYSPYQSDDAHPTYLDRVRGIAQQIVEEKKVNADLVARANLLKKTIDGIKDVAHSHAMTQITLKEPILRAGFIDDTLRFISTKFNGYTDIPIIECVNKIKGELKEFNESASHFKGIKSSFDSSTKIEIFSFPKAGSYCLIDGRNELYKLKDTGMQLLPESIFQYAFKPAYDVFFAGQPSKHIYLINEKDYVSISKETTSKASQTDLRALLKKRYQLEDIRFDQFEILINGKNIGIPFSSVSAKLQRNGIVILDGSDLKVIKSVLFQLPDDFFEVDTYGKGFYKGENVIFFSTDNDTYITTTQKTNGENTSWVLWKVFEDKPPIFLKRFDFLENGADGMKVLGIISPALYKQRIETAGEDKFIINWSNDFCSLVDLREGDAAPIFYPGGETQIIRSSREGLVLFYLAGTRRCYLINLNL